MVDSHPDVDKAGVLPVFREVMLQREETGNKQIDKLSPNVPGTENYPSKAHM